jgi:tryptophan-rich sensory protein
MKRNFVLLVLIILVVGGGLAIGYLTRPGEWYAQLAKPSFTPPGWVFGPVWTVLYVMIAIAGARIFLKDPYGPSYWLWWGQLALNFAWSPVFFSAHNIGLALVVILLLLAAVLGLMFSLWRRDRATAWLLVPYTLWVGFASVLNASIFALN